MWKNHPARSELLALYREVDALLAPVSCPASADCCHFARTNREPYPHAVELAEVEHARAALGSRKLALQARAAQAPESRCPLLGGDGRCRIYASRPFGCRTYFCERAEGIEDVGRETLRKATAEIGRRIADLSARAFPRDPGPRALTKALK